MSEKACYFDCEISLMMVLSALRNSMGVDTLNTCGASGFSVLSSESSSGGPPRPGPIGIGPAYSTSRVGVERGATRRYRRWIKADVVDAASRFRRRLYRMQVLSFSKRHRSA